jgi:hypothetical protein
MNWHTSKCPACDGQGKRIAHAPAQKGEHADYDMWICVDCKALYGNLSHNISLQFVKRDFVEGGAGDARYFDFMYTDKPSRVGVRFHGWFDAVTRQLMQIG